MDSNGLLTNSSFHGLDNHERKINIVFQTTQGLSKNLVLSYGTTISKALRQCLWEFCLPDFIESEKKRFLHNAVQLKFEDQTPVEVFFKNNINPKVIVNDINNFPNLPSYVL